MHDRSVIITRGDGTPFERPEHPGPDAPIEEKLAYHRALCDYHDALRNYAIKEFVEAFSKELRR